MSKLKTYAKAGTKKLGIGILKAFYGFIADFVTMGRYTDRH